jgi:hypothetical protein
MTMDTSGHSNDALMMVVPIGVALIVASILLGGPMEALEVVDALLRDIVGLARDFVSALF